MKTFLPAAVVVLFASVPFAQAAPGSVHHIDDHAQVGVRQARALRAEIASRFSSSRDGRELVREADELLDTMNSLHDAVHRGRSKSSLRSLVDHAQLHVRNLDRRLGRSDYLHATPGYRQLTPTGYISYPATRHAGAFHVDAVQRMLDQMSSNLRQLESDLEPTFRFDRRQPSFGYGPSRGW